MLRFFERIKSHKLTRPVVVGLASGGAISAIAVVASADTFTAVDYSDIAPAVTALQQQITVSNIVSFIAACIGVCVTLAFMWWGVRKVVRMFTSAWKKGKIKV